MDNPINALRKFLAGSRGEVSLPEFTSFWKSLSDDDKNEFRSAIQRWDGKSEFIPPVVAVAPLALPASSLAAQA